MELDGRFIITLIGIIWTVGMSCMLIDFFSKEKEPVSVVRKQPAKTVPVDNTYFESLIVSSDPEPVTQESSLDIDISKDGNPLLIGDLVIPDNLTDDWEINSSTVILDDLIIKDDDLSNFE